MTTDIFHDFETYSEADLKRVGVYRYATHPSTEALMLAYARRGESPKLWVPAEGEPMPIELRDLLISPHTIWHAFNAQFERLIWEHVLGWKLPASRFRCTMQHAWHLSFSGTLKQVGEQLGLPADKQKDQRGHSLIMKFCKPAPRRHLVSRYTHETSPEEWAEFKEYCRQDVIAEMAIEHLLGSYPVPPEEQKLWEWDQTVNDRGVPVDRELVEDAVSLNDIAKADLLQEMIELTGLENPNSNEKLQEWFGRRGYALPDMQETTLLRLRPTMESFEQRVIDCKLQIGKTSTSKWAAFQRATGEDGRLRGMFQFGGAQRTQRWAGRIVQLQNLKSPMIDHIVESAELIHEKPDTIRTIFGRPLDLLSQTIRCAITAGDGKALVACDLSSIESRVLGYLANCERINRCFREGRDTYKDFASHFYAIPYDAVTKQQRKFCKPPVLGAGYQLGAKTMVDYAAGMGVAMTLEDAGNAVSLWRETYPEVPAMWQWLVRATQDATENWSRHEGYHVVIHRDRNFLMIDLPSGRRIYYYQPLVQMLVPPWEKEKIEKGEITLKEAERRATLTYMGMNQYTKKWERLSTHGGKITENIVQATARDILAWQMKEMELQGFKHICAHVHDEAIAEVEEDRAEEALKYMESCMSVAPPWVPGLLLGAAGIITKRYRKD